MILCWRQKVHEVTGLWPVCFDFSLPGGSTGEFKISGDSILLAIGADFLEVGIEAEDLDRCFLATLKSPGLLGNDFRLFSDSVGDDTWDDNWGEGLGRIDLTFVLLSIMI